MAYQSDPYADIDFEEVNDVTGLANDEIKCLKVRNETLRLYFTCEIEYLS